MTGKAAVFISILLPMLLFNTAPCYPDQRYYESNNIGMKLQEINEEDIHKYEYVLLVEESVDMEKKSLFSEMKMIKRWELSLYNNRNVREERTYSEDILESIRYFDRRGRLTEEHLYSDNLFTQKTVYFYRQNQELYQAKTFSSNGDLLYEEQYEFNRQGMIRRVTRTWSDDGRVQVTSFIYGKGQLIEEVYSSDGEMTISRFDETGRLSFLEVWKEGERTREKMFYYNKEDGILLSTSEKDLSGGFDTKSFFNEDEHVIREIVTKDDVNVYEQTYF